MITASGVRAYPTQPEATEVRIRDIAHALGRICRFGGHVACAHYSVAQHSVIVSRNVPRQHALAGLLHDAAEAYIGDMIKPLKQFVSVDCEPIAALEWRWHKRIADAFGLPHIQDPSIKRADVRALWTERRDVMAPSVDDPRAYPERIIPLPSLRATSLFLARYLEVTLA
jgi:5'-deoxynucleotidase YfbR-like HD superfamily hydrolase